MMEGSYAKSVLHDRSLAPRRPIMHLPLRTGSENQGEVNDEEQYHPKYLYR